MTAWQARRLLLTAVAVVVVKVDVETVIGYRRYLPPDFTTGFLIGREDAFFDWYRWAFWAHLAAGPLTLLLAVPLNSNRFLVRHRRWHRRLGRLQAGLILAVLVPSGLAMAQRAAAGPVAVVAFSLLSVATGVTTAIGVGEAIAGRLVSHRRWMQRTTVLLGSAVVIRLLGGAATLADWNAAWIDPTLAWVCWLGPLAVLEGLRRIRERSERRFRPAERSKRVQPTPVEV